MEKIPSNCYLSEWSPFEAPEPLSLLPLNSLYLCIFSNSTTIQKFNLLPSLTLLTLHNDWMMLPLWYLWYCLPQLLLSLWIIRQDICDIFSSVLRPTSWMHSENATFKTVTWCKCPVAFHVPSHFHMVAIQESWRFMYSGERYCMVKILHGE